MTPSARLPFSPWCCVTQFIREFVGIGGPEAIPRRQVGGSAAGDWPRFHGYFSWWRIMFIGMIIGMINGALVSDEVDLSPVVQGGTTQHWEVKVQ